jgi:hypothetical protein
MLVEKDKMGIKVSTDVQKKQQLGKRLFWNHCSNAGEKGCKRQEGHQAARLWMSLWIMQRERVSKSRPIG